MVNIMTKYNKKSRSIEKSAYFCAVLYRIITVKPCLMETSVSVGSRIKSIREAKNLTIQHVAERSGLTMEQIERIEENDNLPSLAPLIKIARALGVRLGTFLDDMDNMGPVVCRRAELAKSISFSSETASSHNNLSFYSMALSKTGRHMEPFLIDIDSASCNGYQLSSHEGEEFIFVLEGNIEITYGKETYKLGQGESIYYDSIVDHNVHAADASKAKILAVVYTPY